MTINNSTNRVAKNTMIMYIRMIFLMFIGFFTSRLLLQLLGVDDYGIYSVVGSVLATFAALKSIFTESIQRFLNFQKGVNSIEGQRDVYTISIYIHIVLALLFLVIIEIVGSWLIMHKLVLPVDKLSIALFVFHASVISVIISILTIPFDSVIIANERMDVYAYLSIFDGLFKLVVLLALPLFDVVYLEVYAIVLVIIPLVYLIVSVWFTWRFDECRIQKHLNKNIFKEIATLSGWNFFGNISFSILHEGINFILNVFGGLAYNAARGIAYHVKGIACQLSNNMLIAARPMIMQSAASEGHEKLFRKTITISRLSFFMMLLTVAPIITFSSGLLSVWLKKVPDYADIFTQLVLMAVLIRSLHEPLNILYMSLAKIKRMMIIEVIVMLTSVLIIYIFLSSGYQIIFAFIILSIMEALIILTLYINAVMEVHFYAKDYLIEVILPTSILTVILLLTSYGVINLTDECGGVCIMAGVFLYELFIVSVLYIFLNRQEKDLLFKFIKKVPIINKILDYKCRQVI